MNKPPLVTSEKSIFNLMQVINDTIQYAETVEQTLLAAMRDVVAGEGVEIAPVPDASASVKGVVTLADSTTDPELYAVSVALLNAVVGQIGQTTGTLSSLGTTNKANLVNAINEVKNATTDTAGYVGNLQGLNTTAKANLVAAINEVKSLAGTDYSTVIGVLNTLTTTAKNNLVSAINEVQSNQGALNGLNTTSKSSLVGAINEVKTKADGVGTLTSLTTTAKSNLVVAVNEILALAGDLATLSTTAKSNLVGAINELKSSIGTLSALTTTSKTSIVTAINELKTSIGNLASLTTTEKTSTVLAINEVKTLADSAHTKVGTLASLTTTEKNSLVGALNEVKQYANDGKTAIATAVTAKGVTASPADTFSSLATKIGQIPTGGGGGGTGGTEINGAVDYTTPANSAISAGDVVGIKYNLRGSFDKIQDRYDALNPEGRLYDFKMSLDGNIIGGFEWDGDARNHIAKYYKYDSASDSFTQLLVSEPLLGSNSPLMDINHDGSKIFILDLYDGGITRGTVYTRSGDSYTKTADYELPTYVNYLEMHPYLQAYWTAYQTESSGYLLQFINYETGVVIQSMEVSVEGYVVGHSEDYTKVYVGHNGTDSVTVLDVDLDNNSLPFNTVLNLNEPVANAEGLLVLGDYMYYCDYNNLTAKALHMPTNTYTEIPYWTRYHKYSDSVYLALEHDNERYQDNLVLLTPENGMLKKVLQIADNVSNILHGSTTVYLDSWGSYGRAFLTSLVGSPGYDATSCDNTLSPEYSKYAIATQNLSAGEEGVFKLILSK